MKEKKLIVKFHKNKTCEIPAQVIAETRAKYYALLDGYDDDSQEFLDEVNRALDDEFIIFDWVENNMRWSEISQYAENIEIDCLDWEIEWYNGDRTMSVNW